MKCTHTSTTARNKTKLSTSKTASHVMCYCAPAQVGRLSFPFVSGCDSLTNQAFLHVLMRHRQRRRALTIDRATVSSEMVLEDSATPTSTTKLIPNHEPQGGLGITTNVMSVMFGVSECEDAGTEYSGCS
jgi:hypothetical protein